MECFTGALVAAISVFLCLCLRVCFKKELLEARGLAVFISGCDTGLGNRLAIYFDSLGCDVYAGCLNPASAREKLPESVTVVPLDLCDANSVKEAVDLVENSLKKLGKGKFLLCIFLF